MAVSALVSSTWLRQQIVNGLKNIRLLDGEYYKVDYCSNYKKLRDKATIV